MNYINKFKLIALFISLSGSLISNNLESRCEQNAIASTTVVNSILKSENNPGTPKSKVKKIVIDAGHGGKDKGCSGSLTHEKHIVLELAMKLKEKFRASHPEIEIIFTREHDVFIPLHKRVEIANKNEADLFISLHCNSLYHRGTRGMETYVMGVHNSVENLNVAKRENEVILLEQDYSSHYEGYDPNSSEGHIMLAMSQNEYLDRSINFAKKIDESFKKRTQLKSRGVKQAGFVVLKQATMPSVLIETGFLTNNKDENYLMTQEGQDEVTDAIIKAFTLYSRELEEEHESFERQQESQNNTPVVVTYPATPSTQVTNDPNHHKILSVTRDNELGQTNTTASTPNTTGTSSKIYRIQIAASINKPIKNNSDIWSKVSDVEVKQEDNMYKYVTGNFLTIREAESAKAKMRSLGFKGAFIVAYEGDIRVNL